MCVTCEHMLYEEHAMAEAGPFEPCPECGKFPSNAGQPCYHCFSVGEDNIVHECPKCAGKPWSEEFLRIKAEIEKAEIKGDGDPSDSIF